MGTVVVVTDPIMTTDYLDRCRVCRGLVHAPFTLCFCCHTLLGQLQMPLVPIVTMVEYCTGDRMHRRLRGYKDAPVSEARDQYRDQLAAMASRWVHSQGRLFGSRPGSAWNTVVTVPSSHRPAGCPVDAIVARVPELGAVHRPLLTRGTGTTDHLQSDRSGFEMAPGIDRRQVRGLRVLVFDDSVVTGARAQSAAAALRLAGAQVVGVLALGRVMQPLVSRTG